MKKNKINRGVGDTIFVILNYLFFAVLSVAILAPIFHLVSKSISMESDVITGSVGIFPNFSRLQWDSYRIVFQNNQFLVGFRNTFLVTIIGTLASLFVSTCCAYTLSKPYLRGRKILILLCIFVMVFSGGLIPTYLVLSMLKLVNTFTVLWILGVFNVYNMLIIKSNFEGIPAEMEESATIDGAGQLRIFFTIYLPLVKASLAVIGLFFAVAYWNNFYTAMIYTTRPELKTLQLVLKEIIFSVSDVFQALYGGQMIGEATGQSTIAACIVIATLPILLVYPFLQKHFTKGVLTGSVKG